jgi:plastocyanin
LKIEKGSIVEWRVSTQPLMTSGCSHNDGSEEDERDISSIRHVVAFETPQLAQTESNILRVNDTFKVRFIESGTYSYRCQIQPRMRGIVKVFDNVHQLLSQ